MVLTITIPIIASFYFGIWTLLFTIISMFVFYFYTAPPLRFKNKVGIDVLSHALFVNTFPYFFCLVALEDYSVIQRIKPKTRKNDMKLGYCHYGLEKFNTAEKYLSRYCLSEWACHFSSSRVLLLDDTNESR